jgi:predicted metallo-beta-lactamase superfamily hydrolase
LVFLLRPSIQLPYYQYSKFEGLLKQVKQFSKTIKKPQTQINIPTQGKKFRFEKYLIVNGRPYVHGKYGQFLGDDIFLSLPSNNSKKYNRLQVTPNRYR